MVKFSWTQQLHRGFLSNSKEVTCHCLLLRYFFFQFFSLAYTPYLRGPNLLSYLWMNCYPFQACARSEFWSMALINLVGGTRLMPHNYTREAEGNLRMGQSSWRHWWFVANFYHCINVVAILFIVLCLLRELKGGRSTAHCYKSYVSRGEMCFSLIRGIEYMWEKKQH